MIEERGELRQPLVIASGPFTRDKCDAIAEAIENGMRKRAERAAQIARQSAHLLTHAATAAALDPSERNIEALLKAVEESVDLANAIKSCFAT